jgi:hypothetical protein
MGFRCQSPREFDRLYGTVLILRWFPLRAWRWANPIAAGDPSPIRKGGVTFSIARYSAGKLVNPILADGARITCGDFGIHRTHRPDTQV